MAGIAGLGGQEAAYFNMASLLILDHQINQMVKAPDVVPYMVRYQLLSEPEAMWIFDGATNKIKTERLLAKVKLRGIPGYLQLRAALATCGKTYAKLIESIDTNIPPQYSANNASYY